MPRRIQLFLVSALFGICLIGCSTEELSPVDIPTATPPQSTNETPLDQPTVAGPTQETSSTAENTPEPLLFSHPGNCPGPYSILFSATDRSKGGGAVYEFCPTQNEQYVLIPIAADESVAGFDATNSGGLVYSYSESSSTWSLLTLSAEDTAPTQIGVFSEPVGSPRWALDDTWILFIEGGVPVSKLNALNPKSGATFVIYEEYTISNLKVSPDGSSVLFTTSTGQPNVEPPRLVGRLDCSDGTCSSDDLVEVPNLGFKPIWADEGTRIASIVYEDMLGYSGTFLRYTNLDGVVEEEIELSGLDATVRGVSEIAWAEDRVIFIGYVNGTDNVYTFSPGEQSLERLTRFDNTGISNLAIYYNESLP